MRRMIDERLLSLPDAPGADAAGISPGDDAGDSLDRETQGRGPLKMPAAPALPEPPLPPSGAGGIDLDRIAEGFAAEASRRRTASSGIFVFVSFGLPPASLESLARSAARSGAVLVLRGLKEGSLRKTAEAVAELRRVAGHTRIAVDPLLFRRLGVEAAPAFAAFAGGRSAAVAGDVTLGYALEELERSSDPAVREAARDAGKRLRDG